METIEGRTTIVALAKDLENKNAFVFNSSLGLPSPTNKYKKLLEFFEVSISDINELVSINGEYICGQFSYLVYEELPYSNYNRNDQKLINVVKKKYIDKYNDSEFPLYNLCFNDNAKVSLEKRHNVNINQIYKDLHYKRLKAFYDHLEDLMDYDLVKSYVSDEKQMICENVPFCEISRRYFAGDENAGIEILLRKRQDELQIKLSDCDQIKKLVFNFDVLLRAYKLQIGFNEKPDFDKILLARHLSRRYPNSFSVLTLLVGGFKDKIIEYFEKKEGKKYVDDKQWHDNFNTNYGWLRSQKKEMLMEAYIQKKEINNFKMCYIYLYALYEKIKV